MNHVERFRAVMNFQPVDHQTPPGVSLEQYYVFLKLFKEYTELN